MAITYGSNIAASSQGAFAIFPVTDSAGGAAFDILSADISTGVVSAVSSAVPLSTIQLDALSDLLKGIDGVGSISGNVLSFLRKLVGVVGVTNGVSIALSVTNTAGSNWKLSATLSAAGSALVYVPNSAAVGLYTGSNSDTSGGPPSGPAGGVLGYTGSTYPNPNGLAAIANVIPILRGSGGSPTAIEVRPDQALNDNAGTPLTVKGADAGPSATTATGGALTLKAGDGGAGGTVTIAGGDGRDGAAGVAPRPGGGIVISTGISGSTNNTASGAPSTGIQISVQSACDGVGGGGISLASGDGGNGNAALTVAGGDGGNIVIGTGGGGTEDGAQPGGNGGGIEIVAAGGADGGGDGGYISISGGAAGDATATNAAGTAGPIDINAGVGGDANAAGGFSATAGADVTISAGDGGGGAAGETAGDGGDLVLRAGDAGATAGGTAADGGDVLIDAGDATGGDVGAVNIGATVARVVALGRSGQPTVVQGFDVAAEDIQTPTGNAQAFAVVTSFLSLGAAAAGYINLTLANTPAVVDPGARLTIANESNFDQQFATGGNLRLGAATRTLTGTAANRGTLSLVYLGSNLWAETSFVA